MPCPCKPVSDGAKLHFSRINLKQFVVCRLCSVTSSYLLRLFILCQPFSTGGSFVPQETLGEVWSILAATPGAGVCGIQQAETRAAALCPAVPRTGSTPDSPAQMSAVARLRTGPHCFLVAELPGVPQATSLTHTLGGWLKQSPLSPSPHPLGAPELAFLQVPRWRCCWPGPP